MDKELFESIIKKFDFCKPEDDHAVTATGRFRRDLAKQLKNNKALIKGFEKDRHLLYSKTLWSNKSLDTKGVGNVFDNHGKKYIIWQTRTKKCSRGKGRIWFQFRDDQPDAPRPVILLLGCELTGKKEARNSLRIKDFCKKGVVETFKTPIMAKDEQTPDKGRIEDFEEDPDIRPMYHGDYGAMMDLFDSEVGIRPTKEQLETVLNEQVPIFINGQAGTGKTVLLAIRIGTVFQHRSIKGEAWRTLTTCMSQKVVERLESNTKDVITKVFGNEKAGKEFQTTILPEFKEEWMNKPKNERNSIFRSFNLIQYEILDEESQRRFDRPLMEGRTRRIGFSKFARKFYSPRDFRKHMSSELAWFGIRSLIKGFSGRNNGKWLNVQDFEKLVPQRTLEIFNKKEKRILSNCFDSYQNWLDEEGFYDDMDLARAAWTRLESSDTKIEGFDEIYLDEAQDLTDLEFRILLMLLKPERRKNAILAGDPLQTINPTGFDWPRIKDMMYKTLGNLLPNQNIEIPDPMTLTKNYRTPVEMVRMGNILLRNRAYYMREKIPEQSSSKTTEKPTLLQIGGGTDTEKKEETEAIARLLRQPNDKMFIVTYTVDNSGIEDFIKEDQAAQIAQADGLDARLESITDVKGLERDTVVLYRFADMISESVPYLTEKHQREGLEWSKKMKLLFALNRMYIALTRSKKHMFILDSQRGIDQFWKGVFVSDEEVLIEIENPRDTASILINNPKLNEGIDLMKYSEQQIERFMETDDPKFLKWTIEALDEIGTMERDSQWYAKYNRASAFHEEIKADNIGEKNKPGEWVKHLVKAAEHWKDYGHLAKQYQLLRKAKKWNEAIEVDSPERNSEAYLLRAILGISKEGDVNFLVKWVREEKSPEWMPTQLENPIHKKTVYLLTDGKKTNEVKKIIRGLSSSATRNLWNTELIKYFELKNDYKGLKPIVDDLLKKFETSRSLHGGKHWCLLNEFNEPGEYIKLDDKRIEIQQKLIEYSIGKTKEGHQIDVALDYIEMFLESLKVKGKLKWERTDNAKTENIIRDYKYHILDIEGQAVISENMSVTMKGQIHTFLQNCDLKTADSIVEFISVTIGNRVEKNGFDKMRINIQNAIDSPEFNQYCITRIVTSRSCPVKDLLDSEGAVVSLIEVYNELEKANQEKIEKELAKKTKTLKNKMDEITKPSTGLQLRRDRWKALKKLRRFTGSASHLFFNYDDISDREIESQIESMKKNKIADLEAEIKLSSEVGLLTRFKRNLINKDLNGNEGGRKILKDTLLNKWSELCESKVVEREEFTHACVILKDFKRLRKLAKTTKDERISLRIEAEEILTKKKRIAKDLNKAIEIFNELELPGRARHAKSLIPKDPLAEIERLMVPEKGVLGLAEALDIVTAEVKAGRLSKTKALSLINNKRKDMEPYFYGILGSPWSERVDDFAVMVQNVKLPPVEKDPLIHDWFSGPLKDTLFKLKEQKLSKEHMENIKTRMNQLIDERLIKKPGALNVKDRMRLKSYQPLQRRFWSLDSLTQKEKLASLAWFTLFDLFENKPPNKSDLMRFMESIGLKFDESKKVGNLRRELFTQTRPEHEKQTETEMKNVIDRLCKTRGKK